MAQPAPGESCSHTDHPGTDGGLALRPNLWQRVSLPSIVVLLLPPLLAVNGLVSQLLEIHAPSTAIGFGALKDLLLVVLLACTAFTSGLRRVPRMLVGLVIAYVAVGALAGVWSRTAVGAVYGWRNDFFPALLLLAATPVFLDREMRRRWANLVAWTACLAAGLLIATWAWGLEWLLHLGILPAAPGEEFPSSYFSAGEITPRGFSPWVAPNQAGVALVIMLAVVALGSEWAMRRRLLAAVLPVTAIVLTESRSAWLGLAAVGFCLIVFAVWHRHGWKIAVVAAAVSCVVAGVGAWAYFVGSGRMSNDPSLGGHSDSLEEAIALVREHPEGWGLGDVGPRSTLYGGEGILVESSWMLLAIEASVVALALFLAVQAVVAMRLMRTAQSQTLMGVLVIAGSIVSQIVLPTFQEGAVVYLFWLALACALGAAIDSEAADESPGRGLRQGERRWRITWRPGKATVNSSSVGSASTSDGLRPWLHFGRPLPRASGEP